MESFARSSSGTLYHQVFTRLVEAIESGRIADGEKLPTEAELMHTYSVSRTTARRALDELRHQGLVRREPGRGTFWINPVLQANLSYLRSFSDEIRRLGYQPGARLLSSKEISADATVAGHLNIALQSSVLYVRRLRTADDRPIFTCDSYLPLSRFPALHDADYSVNSLSRLFEEVTGRKIVSAIQWIGAAAAEEDVAQLLELKASSPVLRVKRVTYVEGDQPIEYVQAFFHPRRYQHCSELFPQRQMMAQVSKATYLQSRPTRQHISSDVLTPEGEQHE
ncbi:MAG: GntR family transcriptional regulator [Chloroflexota bacterium]|nr:GntR family transcriptional regulator [Chloroflexota bacterium]